MNKAQLGFDLSSLDSADLKEPTHKVSVQDDADGESIQGFIVVGKNSEQFQKVSGAIRIDNIMRAGKRKAQIDTATEVGAGVVSRTVELNDRATALAVVTDWYGFNLEGSPVKFDPSYVAKLFNKFPQWQIKVLAALEVEANFTQG